MSRSAPTIETERLILRSFRREDLDAHAATLGDPDVMRHIGGQALSREDAWRRLLSGVGSWAVLGMGPWAVELRAEGRMVGHCGFFDFERDMEPSITGEPEMGWIFDPSVHGKGIAYEACAAAVEWADANIRASSYPAIVGHENEASQKLAMRLGFERHGDATYKGESIAFFRRTGRPA